ncbi:tetratricopeptide repeat protein [Neorhodopirellula pilleata]|uniref:tetratricopeptide repeat protein n=1 Tax=Neorhodopirellula pilleata TaxID=2714738 RepID=UPI0011B649C5|nr:hypothetical protein [Neorhodopirellula pilleata]
MSHELIQVNRPFDEPASISKLDAGSDQEPHDERVYPQGSIGTDACVACHREQAATYSLTTHARAGRPIEQSNIAVEHSWDDERSGRRFEVRLSDDVMEHHEMIRLSDSVTVAHQAAKVSFEFGSGTHAHTYIFRDGAFACESPLTWYADGGNWNLSPGYDPLTRPSFDRQITIGCIYCHAGRVQIYNGNPNHFKIVEPSIGCERCHGPGAGHVDRYQHQSELERATKLSRDTESTLPSPESEPEFDVADLVVNPASLGRNESEAICAQCHLQGAVLVVAQGADLWDYRPGQLLAENRTDFQSQATSDGFRIVGHTEQMHASRCYQESSTLTCITCHDPHRHGNLVDLRAEYQRACLACHSDESCHVESAIRLEKVGNDCSSCHMPKRPTNVTHAALHDHRIAVHHESFELAGRRVPIDRMAESSVAGESAGTILFPILNSPEVSAKEKDRRWALATHHFYFNDLQKQTIAQDMKRAQAVLLRLHREGEPDADRDVALARDYFDAGMIGPAEQLAKAIMRTEFGQRDAVINATDILARIAMQQQDNAVALQHYDRLTKIRRVAGDHYLLGVCLINAGRTQESIEALLLSLRIDPLLELAHEQLAVLFEHHGDPTRGDAHRKALREIRSFRRSYPSTAP